MFDKAISQVGKNNLFNAEIPNIPSFNKCRCIWYN